MKIAYIYKDFEGLRYVVASSRDAFPSKDFV